jgi:signal recognition particle subunit SEC65
MAELAKYIVEDAKQCSSNIISSYLRNACIKTMPIPSRLYEGTDYWFGAKPIMIEEKDNVTPYLAVETNLNCHRAFIKELMDYVSLNDYLTIGRVTQLRSPEMDILKDTLKQREDDIISLMKQHAVEMATLMREVDEYKETLSEVNEGVTHKDFRHQIHDLQRDISIANTKYKRMAEANETLQWKYEDLEKKYGELYVSNCESRGMASIEMETAYIKQVERLQDSLRKERDKNALAKKETKSSDKKKEEKERLRTELKAAKAKTKALEKKLSDSDSDSDSGSD